MLFFVKNIDDDTILVVWQMTETSAELFALLEQKEFYREDFEKRKYEKRRREWIASKFLIEKYCGADKRVVYDENGKPLLNDGSFNISISHTGDYVALLASKSKLVGVDIEKISNKVLDLKERFMTDEELTKISVGNELNDVLLHWCAKEAAFKMNNERALVHHDYCVKKSETNFEHSFDFIVQWKSEKYAMHYEKFNDFIMVYSFSIPHSSFLTPNF